MWKGKEDLTPDKMKEEHAALCRALNGTKIIGQMHEDSI